MKFTSRIGGGLRALLRRNQVESELDDELHEFLQRTIERNISRGMGIEEATRAARIEIGGFDVVKEQVRDVGWESRVAAFWLDTRYAMRTLLRAKGLTVTVVVTLALGIGANAAIFSVVRGVLLRPLVNRDEDRLIYIRQTAPGIGSENMTFSVPEIKDFRSRATALSAFGEFSTVDFTVIGLGPEPRVVKAGVVNGSFFDVMGLRPVLGRLLNPQDDGTEAASVVVLTHRFWTTQFNSDPAVIGRTLRVASRTATVVGVLEPSVPYPTETEIMANMVTSPHHIGATMQSIRTHRMTELFGRLAPGATLESARTELGALHADILHEHPEAYSAGNVELRVTRLRDQIAGPARPVLLVLLAAAVVVFVIACSNVANLILARSVRRERELAVRAALGAGRRALRRTLLAESLVLCGAGAVLGVLLAQPFVALFARYATRFSIRALDVTVDASAVCVGTGLALVAAVLLAYVPRLPSTNAPAGLGLGTGGMRITASANRKLRAFAMSQIACSFVLLAGAGTVVATLVTLQTAKTGYNTRNVLVFDIPTPAPGVKRDAPSDFHQQITRRVGELPGVDGVALGEFTPWRDAGSWPALPITVEGYTPAAGEETYAQPRFATPNFFALLGVPLLAGREFTEADRKGEPVAIVNQSLAQRMFPSRDVLNRHLSVKWPIGEPQSFRIVGVAADVDDMNVKPQPGLTIYTFGGGSRLFVRAAGDPHALVPEVTRVIREIAANQPVERAATLEDIRAEKLSPERLNAFVFSGFAGIALLIAVVGVAGVLAFLVSARTREFGVRLAIGSSPRLLLTGVLRDGMRIAVVGVAVGVTGGYALVVAAQSFFAGVQLPGVIPVIGAAAVLIGAAIGASLVPAARASRVDVLQALRSE
jgi:putative ABC transport system permease protein